MPGEAGQKSVHHALDQVFHHFLGVAKHHHGFIHIEQLVVQAGDDAESLFEATFALMTGELAVLIADLIDALGGEPQDQDA